MKFKINNKTWYIKELSQEQMKEELKKHYENPDLNGKYYGLTYADIQTIFLDKDLCPDRKRSTLLHELGHCYIITYITHQDKNYNEEDVADIVSNSYDIIHEIVEQYERNNGVNIEQGIDSILLDGKPILYCERQK